MENSLRSSLLFILQCACDHGVWCDKRLVCASAALWLHIACHLPVCEQIQAVRKAVCLLCISHPHRHVCELHLVCSEKRRIHTLVHQSIHRRIPNEHNHHTRHANSRLIAIQLLQTTRHGSKAFLHVSRILCVCLCKLYFMHLIVILLEH